MEWGTQHWGESNNEFYSLSEGQLGCPNPSANPIGVHQAYDELDFSSGYALFYYAQSRGKALRCCEKPYSRHLRRMGRTRIERFIKNQYCISSWVYWW